VLTRHVLDDLAPYVEGELDASARGRVEAHLRACHRCRAALADVRRGMSLASELGPEPMPAADAARTREAVLAGRAVHRARSWPATTLPAAAAVFLAVAAGYWHLNRPWLRLHPADDAPFAFEVEAARVHERLRDSSDMQFASTDAAGIQRWLRERAAPIASLAGEQPPEEAGRFQPLGASVSTVAGVRASLVAYRIDGRPVTLVLARQNAVPDAPSSGWISKWIVHRQTPEGRHALTWSTGGQTYVLVSELDGLGQRACLMCHTAPEFREAIRATAAPAAAGARAAAPRDLLALLRRSPAQ
jgi:anti-sigma factor RsiW